MNEKVKTMESVVSRLSSTILRTHFGKGPKSVYVNIVHPYVCIQIREFISPVEKILLSKNEGTKVFELRDLMMDEIKSEFKRSFWKEAELDVVELYADWNLDGKSGMILAILKEGKIEKQLWLEDVNKKDLLEEISKVSEVSQKEPGSTEVFWLSDRSLLIRRIDIFTLLEKELINLGFTKTLKLAKRPIEQNLFKQSNLESILKCSIREIYMDWNFNEDKGYAVLVLQKYN
ncbi:uncharacterized protein YbcI [Planomicrobium stackebrandtii]|uniref:Uncharacterized protein YbcI n=1 Tax=Planomicrobium stackebrandtii TaxID=253160 RepID=A0ABU0GRI5_9BACL|nr:uncharacterized protein YbcI [Planomicrobium stackebrandtii]